MESQRDASWQAASIGGMLLSLLAALAMVAVPTTGMAQGQNGCQAALAQVQQARNQIILNHTNEEQTLHTNRQNQMLECQKKGIGGGAGAGAAVNDCEKQVSDIYAASEIDLQQAFNDAMSQEQIVENDVAQGKSCAWTPEEITQFVGTIGQAAAQLAQSAAQIISAAKGKSATPASSGSTSAGSKPTAAPATPPATSPPTTKPPAAPKPPSTPKPPTAPSSGSTPPASGTPQTSP